MKNTVWNTYNVFQSSGSVEAKLMTDKFIVWLSIRERKFLWAVVNFIRDKIYEKLFDQFLKLPSYRPHDNIFIKLN